MTLHAYSWYSGVTTSSGTSTRAGSRAMATTRRRGLRAEASGAFFRRHRRGTLIEDRRVDLARVDVGHVDPVGPLLQSDFGPQGGQRELRRAVGRTGQGHGPLARDRRDVDDQAPPSLPHGGQGRVDAVEGPRGIDRKQLVPVGRVEIGKAPLGYVHPRTVDEDLQRADLLLDPGNQRLCVRPVSHVAGPGPNCRRAGNPAAACCSRWGLRPAIATRHPSAARARAIPRPIPLPPPVTNAVLPESSMMLGPVKQ